MTDHSSSAENAAIYAAGLVQGVVLVTFPAASSVLTSHTYFGLSSTEYGSVFVPQVVAAVAASLVGGRLTGRLGSRTVLRLGLGAGLVAMALLALLVATALVGTGFGLTVPVLNTLTADHHAGRVDTAVLTLNALLGTGTALAPVLTAASDGLGVWWALPVVAAALMAVLLLASLRLPLALAHRATGSRSRTRLGRAFVPFAVVAMLYGVCETTSGNWSETFVTGTVHASSTAASFALTAFWASVTVGRVIFALVQKVIPARWMFRLLPFVVALGYLLLAVAHGRSAAAAIGWFVLIGLGCSALLPLVISFAEQHFPAAAATASGTIVAFYQVGYGVAAFAVGPLLSASVPLTAVVVAVAVAALALGAVAPLASREGGPARNHQIRTTAHAADVSS